MGKKRSRQERIDIVNQIIEKIASEGREFLYSKNHKRAAYFVHDGSSLWYVEHYAGVPLKMIKGSARKTRKHEQFFSSGGTMWGLINDFKDFIWGDDDSNHNNGYGGLYCPHWGYTAEQMKEIRDYAVHVGYLKAKES